MILVVDANILFAALIKKGVTAGMLFNPDLILYSTEFALNELRKYSKLLATKTSRDIQTVEEMIALIKEVITIVPAEEYDSYIQNAITISPDPHDIPYFALALRMKCGIWSNDKLLKQQRHVLIYSTSELMHHEKQ